MAHQAGSTTPRSAADIAAELERTRGRMSDNVESLREYFTPSSVARRGSERATGWFLDDFGGIRPGRVAAVVLPVVAAGLVLGFRRRGR